MNSDEYFKQVEDFVAQNLEHKLVELEKLRKIIWSTTRIAAGIALIFTLLLLFVAPFERDFDLAFACSYFIFGSLAMVFLGQKPYKKRYKNEIIQPLFQAIFPNMSYYPERHLEIDAILSSRILDLNYTPDTIISGEDLVITNIDGMPFEMSEIFISENTTHANFNLTKTTTFKGLLGFMDLNYSTYGGILHVVEKTKFRKFPELLKINLESPRLAEIYDFYSNDEVFARFILNPAVMDYLLDLHQRFNQKITLIVNDRKIFFSWKPVSTNKISPEPVNLFDPKIYLKATDYKQILDIVKELLIIINILRFIKINRQGWAKRF